MKLFGVSSLLASIVVGVAKADVCMMLYQMADNDLEYFIRQDNNELISSTAIKDPTLTTWVYFDGRNYGSTEDITTPLEDISNPDGTPVMEKAEGSLYLNWDHAQGKMIVNASSTQELNGDDPKTLFDFLAYAMTDCVARGSTEYMLILSSHGSGMLGFGGDENTARRRQLIQSNQNIVVAVQSALDVIEGAPEKLDVLGFDACLMSAVDALDEYRNITKYYLASEAVEPGHGWAYNYLEPADTALEYATNLHDNFLQQTQVVDYHLTPKTMAIVAADMFTPFLNAWDALFAEMNTQISSDKNIHTITQRARLNTLSFMGGVDTSTNTPSATDIGSFFETFRNLCSIDPNSDLETLMQSAETAYADMFITRGVGPGTPPATGMHILWPQRQVYVEQDLRDIMLNEMFVAATASAPSWLDFLETFYEAPAPDAVSENSVCQQTVVSDLEADNTEGLLLNPEVVASGGSVTAFTTVTVGTDSVLVNYGIDLTYLLETRLRHLKETIPTMANDQNRKSINHPLKPRGGNAERRLQTADYFILFGGDVFGGFEGPDFVASWDKNFYLLGDGDSAEQVYATDAGNGLKSIPVMYFARNNPVTASDLPLGTSIQEVTLLGGVFGFLTVSLADAVESVITSYVLYTYDATGALSETPASAGGRITPVLFSELSIGGTLVTEFVGGFNSTIFDFTADTVLAVVVINATTWIDSFEELDSVVIDMSAFDNDIEDGFDFYSTTVPYDDLGGSSGSPPSDQPPTPTDGPPSAEPPTAGGDGGSSSGRVTMLWTAQVVILALTIMLA